MLVAIPISTVVGIALRFANHVEIQPMVLTNLSGTIGGYIGMIRRMWGIPANNDRTANFLDLPYGKVSVTLAPIE